MSPEELYDFTYRFLKERYPVDQIKRYFDKNASIHFDKLEISSKGLHCTDAIKCVIDKARTIKLLYGIRDTIKKGDSVIEAGIGVGILSVMAAICGAKKVLGLEINKETLRLANEFLYVCIKEKIVEKGIITFSEKNAINFRTKEVFDLLISENICTGSLYEMQHKITNNLIRFLKKKSKVIPEGMKSYIQTGYLSKEYKNCWDVREIGGLKKFRITSKPILYDTIRFNKKISEKISKNVFVNITEYTNVAIIYSKIQITKNLEIKRSESFFLGSDIFVFLNREYNPINKDMALFIKYKRGDTISNIKLKLKQKSS